VAIPKYNTRFRPWTRAEVKLLGTAPDEEIAKRLNRAPVAIRVRRHRLRISNPFPPLG
jgi:hypothetical protein